MFQKRRKSFGRSLQQILIQVSHDDLVRNLLQERVSSQFVFDRIEEIIRAILSDDREQFIDVLLQKLQNFETLYSKEHTENIKSISDRLLSVSKEQNLEEISNVRRIQTLIEQVKALQAEIVTLRALETARLVDLNDIKGTDKFGKTFFDTNSPLYYHIFANCDLTEFDLKVKLIETDAKATKEMLLMMNKKMHQIFDIVKEKTLTNTKLYRKQIENLRKEAELSRIKIIELQSHFDKSVLPQLLEKHKQSSLKHRKILQQKMNEIEELKSQLINANTQVKTLNSEKQQFVNTISILERQKDEGYSSINSLKEEKFANKHTINQQLDEIKSLNRQLEQLKQENTKTLNNFREAQDEMLKLKRSNSERDQEIVKISTQLKILNDQIPRDKEANEIIVQELAATKRFQDNLQQQLKDATEKNKALDKKIKNVEPKLEQTNFELDSVKEQLRSLNNENEQKSQELFQNSKELDNRKDKITKLETSLTESNAVSKQQQEEITSLKSEKRNLQNTLQEIEQKFEQASQSNEKLRKDLVDIQMTGTRQNAKIDSLTEIKAQLQNEIDHMSNQNTKLESENRKLSLSLKNAEDENSRLKEQRQQMMEQAANDADEQESLGKQVKELTKQLKDAKNRIEEGTTNASEQKRQNNNFRNKVEELEANVQQLQQTNEKNEKTILQNDTTIKNLENKCDILNTNYKNAAEKLQKQMEINNDNEKVIDSLQNSNKEMNDVLNSIQKIIPQRSIKDFPNEIEKLANLANFAENVGKAIKITSSEGAVSKIQDMLKQSEVMKKINEIFPSKSSNDLVRLISSLKSDNEKLRNEKNRIAELISSSDGNVDLSQTISEIIEKQTKLNNELNQAADFISNLLSIITGPSINPTRLAFPLKSNIETRLIDLVTRIKKRADGDREQIEKALEKARSYGFDGESIVEAAEFIVARESENERQQTMSMIGRELGDVRNLSSSEKQSYIKKIEELKKKISKLRETLSQQMNKSRITEESLNDEIDKLQKEARQLKADLETERKVREELTRLGAGLSTDTNYLRSKLSQKELRLVDFAEKMAKSEKEAKQIHNKQKSMRVTMMENVISSQSDI